MAPRPRGRTRKRGEGRLDAALDAMAPYGFPNKLVRQTVSQLLKVYGGNDGWVFIEDSAYTLLIDTLLQKQQQNDDDPLPLPQPQGCLLEDNPKDGPDEASPAGCSNRALLPCANAEASGDAPSTSQAVDTKLATGETGNQPPIMAVDTTSPINNSVNELLPIKLIDTSTATSTPSNQPPIKAVETVLATNENDNQVPIKAKDTVSANNKSESPQTKSTQPLSCHKRRKPCYGWISNDDDEEELMELPPARSSNALVVNGVVN